MSKRVFVSGASGFIGRHMCLFLIKEGCTVHTLIRGADKCSNDLNIAGPPRYLNTIGVKSWDGDLWDTDILKLAMTDVDIVIHCAGDPSFGNGPQYHRANVELTAHVIDIVKIVAPNLQRFVFVSTIGAVDRPNGDSCMEALNEESLPVPSSDYGRSKLQAENIVRKSNLPYSIIRPTMVVGSDMRSDSHFSVFSRNAHSRSMISWVAWPGKFSVVHVDDLTSALWLAATHKSALGKTFFCAGEPISVVDCFDQSRPNTLRIPIAWCVALGRPVIRWLPFAAKAMLLPALTASDARLRQLGWQPQYSASSALLEVISREAARLDPGIDPGGQTVITGAASGLGRALVECLAPTRQYLLLIDRDRVGLRSIAAKYPNCRSIVVDLAEDTGLEGLLRTKEWNEYPITELFTCAGIGLKGRVQELSFESHKKMFSINVLAGIFLALNVLETMQRGQFGRIVFISSSSAFQPLPFMATYAATKSALLSLGEAWSYEIRNQGVQLTIVCPGGMQTNFQKNGGVKELDGETLMSPNEVAQEILLGLREQRTTLIVSLRSFAMSLLARVLPRQVSLRLWGNLMAKMR
jgi:short-subunit dehydrogenase